MGGEGKEVKTFTYLFLSVSVFMHICYFPCEPANVYDGNEALRLCICVSPEKLGRCCMYIIINIIIFVVVVVSGGEWGVTNKLKVSVYVS